jgi:predicted Fe-S protein YdhL (DUF1289 family)
MSVSVYSPCIGICSTVYGDNICRGCKRSYTEVIDWNRYDAAQKKRIHQRLQHNIEKVVADFLVVENSTLLKAQLDQVALRPVLYDSPLYWAHELLRLKANQIEDLQSYGLGAKPPYDRCSANALFTEMDAQLYRLQI